MNPEPKPQPSLANIPFSGIVWNTTTSTTATNVYMGPITCYVTSDGPDKPVKKDATARWLDRCKASADKRFKEEIIRIKEECAKNAWRPHVSSSQKADHGLDLQWWTLGKPDGDGNHDDWRKELWRWKHDWCGITITDLSDFEIRAINRFCRALSKKTVYIHVSEPFSDSNRLIGDHMSDCHAYWFKNLDDHNAFDAMLDALPWRQYMIELAHGADLKAIRAHFRGKNYRIVKGQEKSVVTFAEDPKNHTDMWAKFKFS